MGAMSQGYRSWLKGTPAGHISENLSIDYNSMNKIRNYGAMLITDKQINMRSVFFFFLQYNVLKKYIRNYGIRKVTILQAL